jgi:TolB-like protein
VSSKRQIKRKRLRQWEGDSLKEDVVISIENFSGFSVVKF